MDFTKNEKKLLVAIIETWRLEGCPNVNNWCWGRDERNPEDKTKEGDDIAGSKLIEKAIEGLERKLKMKI